MIFSSEESAFKDLFGNFPQTGTVVWIGVRPKSRQPMEVLEEVFANIGGLTGDRSNKGNAVSKRQVTLIQAEHLQAVASFLGKDNVDPALIRRNIVVKGINLNALKDKQFRIGEVVLEMTGFCFPCSRMEENLGKGGFNAMRGHGGINCKVIQEGKIVLGDSLEVL
ncbi:MOSC domain-containing protein YiiM [Arcicella aurantiaca]|uniref:MOSC domain-containing protein YiiM n=1 Tax=Arcicella aurantiaca TaxID=591202 RepID=A0A316ECW0_9BACT|nr:MOSC domain-containing protein [Arcicella aurantiaca]PWK27980.1 MOSC domain-containing protein YiiM [Arcicella aurantiaca]